MDKPQLKDLKYLFGYLDWRDMTPDTRRGVLAEYEHATYQPLTERFKEGAVKSCNTRQEVSDATLVETILNK